ncbi:hypothetical protein HDU96_001309 [Phlyctochytrium bullatum]|nr:hypothetical protein HDU96_001309 [Phlyctochytrium bullatum]
MTKAAGTMQSARVRMKSQAEIRKRRLQEEIKQFLSEREEYRKEHARQTLEIEKKEKQKANMADKRVEDERLKIEMEYATKMKALELKEERILWTQQRFGFSDRRNDLLMRELENPEAFWKEVVIWEPENTSKSPSFEMMKLENEGQGSHEIQPLREVEASEGQIRRMEESSEAPCLLPEEKEATMNTLAGNSEQIGNLSTTEPIIITSSHADIADVNSHQEAVVVTELPMEDQRNTSEPQEAQQENNFELSPEREGEETGLHATQQDLKMENQEIVLQAPQENTEVDGLLGLLAVNKLEPPISEFLASVSDVINKGRRIEDVGQNFRVDRYIIDTIAREYAIRTALHTRHKQLNYVLDSFIVRSDLLPQCVKIITECFLGMNSFFYGLIGDALLTCLQYPGAQHALLRSSCWEEVMNYIKVLAKQRYSERLTGIPFEMLSQTDLTNLSMIFKTLIRLSFALKRMVRIPVEQRSRCRMYFKAFVFARNILTYILDHVLYPTSMEMLAMVHLVNRNSPFATPTSPLQKFREIKSQLYLSVLGSPTQSSLFDVLSSITHILHQYCDRKLANEQTENVVMSFTTTLALFTQVVENVAVRRGGHKLFILRSLLD